MRRSFAWRVVLNAVGLYVVAGYLVEGITVQGVPALLIAALVLGIVNSILRPIIVVLSLPINILTLGLLTFVINGLMLRLTASLVPGFSVDSFWTAVWGAILLSVISYILNSLIKDRDY